MTGKQVFISHVFEERHVAEVLKKYVEQAFRNEFPVFAAFDGESIGGGKKWFNHITEGLRQSRVALVLVSHASRRRPWLSFEAGFGDGAGTEVIPVSVRGFSLGQLEFPLAGYQGHPIHDLPSILADITNRFHLPSEKPDLDSYLNEVRSAEANMAYKSLEVRPFVRENSLMFEMENTGNTDIELLMLEVLVPRSYVSEHWNPGLSPFMHFEEKRLGDKDYVWFACTSRRGEFGVIKASLRPIITPAMGVVEVEWMRIPITQGLGFSDMRAVLYYQIHAVDYPTERERKILAEIESR